MTRPRGRPQKYDWDSLFNGEEQFCWPGQDFQCAPASFRALIYRTVAVRNLRLLAPVHLDKNTGLVRFRVSQDD